MTCAGALLAACAFMAGGTHETRAPTRAGVGPVARSASIALFVAVREGPADAPGPTSASVETASSDQPQVVGPDGIRLAVPAGVPSDVRVLVAGAKCRVTLGPKMAGRAVMVVVDRAAPGASCAARLLGPAAVAGEASLAARA
jgi:hypothetical protein